MFLGQPLAYLILVFDLIGHLDANLLERFGAILMHIAKAIGQGQAVDEIEEDLTRVVHSWTVAVTSASVKSPKTG